MCVLASVRVCVRLFTNVTHLPERTYENLRTSSPKGYPLPTDSGTHFHWSLAPAALAATPRPKPPTAAQLVVRAYNRGLLLIGGGTPLLPALFPRPLRSFVLF